MAAILDMGISAIEPGWHNTGLALKVRLKLIIFRGGSSGFLTMPRVRMIVM